MSNLIFSNRQIQLVFSDENNKVEGFAQLFLNGDLGIMYSLSGKNMFRSLIEHMDEIFKECNINKLDFIMEPHVVKKMMEYDFDGFLIISKIKIMHDGREMIEARIIRSFDN